MEIRRRRAAKSSRVTREESPLRPVDFQSLGRIGLTARECEVLGWVAHGKRDAEIARILGIAPKTVGKHVEHLLAKLHVENRTAAVSIGYDRLHALAKDSFR